MILEIIFLITSIIIGLILTQTIFPSKEWISFFCKTIVFSIIFQTIEAFVLNYLLNDWNYFLIIGIILNLILAFVFRSKIDFKKKFEWKKLFLFAILFLGFYLLYQHGMNVQGNNVTSSYPVWGDALFHFSIANNFLEKSISERDLQYPIFSGARLAYPFLIDYHLYLFIKAGVNPYYFYLFFAVLMNAILIFLMLEFMSIFVSNKLKKIIVTCLILLTSSLGIFFLFNGSFNQNYSIPTPTGIFGMTPMVITDFYPRRSADLVYPLFFMFLISIATGEFDKLIKTNKKILIGILIGLTSFFEVHFTLIILLLLALKWLLDRDKNVFRTGLIAFISFIPNVLWIMTSGNNNSLKLQPGFFSTSLEGLPITLFVNLLPLLIPIIIGLIYYKKLDKTNRLLLLLGLAIFVISNFIQFHAWNWDNIKFIRYAQFALIPVFLLKFNKKILIIFLIIFGLSGISTILFYYNNTYEFLSQDRTDFANFIKNTTSSNEIILTSSEPDNPAIYLAGRKTLAGGDGWLWSHGIPYYPRYSDLKDKISKNEFEQIKQQYGVQYFSTSENFQTNKLELLYQKSDWHFYKIR
ncbi:Uncharacterised protein [uncultured archaeon]|nr:Uncharacterised protein [uncultured archaeon]